jgi:hypothetical protein
MHNLRHSLGTRMLACTMIFAAIAVLSLSAVFVWTYNRDLDRQLTSRADATAGFLAGQSQFAMLVGDRAQLERIAANAIAGQSVVFVEFNDAQGSTPVVLRKEGGRAGAPSIEVSRPVMRPAQVGQADWDSGESTAKVRNCSARYGWVFRPRANASLVSVSRG